MVLESRKQILGEQHPDTLRIMANLAVTYGSQGKWDKAVGLEEMVLESRKQILGERHPDTLGAMANLAVMYEYQGKYDEAMALQEILQSRKN
jgi:tetratricopeptide (TPR) repeat protein